MSEDHRGASVTISRTESAAPPDSVQMNQLLAGFQISQALYVVAKLGVPSALLDGPKSVATLAADTGADPVVLLRLIRTLASVGVFRLGPDGIAEVTPLGATLAEEHPESCRAMALFWMETHYASFGDLLHTALTGEPAAEHHLGMRFMDWLSADADRIGLLNNAMAGLTSTLRIGLFDDYRLPAGPIVADIGGGDGTVLATLLAAEPERRGIVFDLPQVVSGARRTLERTGLTDRVDIVGGSFFETAPAADVYVVSQVLHDWDDESCLRILRSIATAAAPGARLVVIELVVPDGSEPHLAKMIDLTMLGTTAGRERSPDEYRTLFAEGGFTLDRIIGTESPYSFLEASLTG